MNFCQNFAIQDLQGSGRKGWALYDCGARRAERGSPGLPCVMMVGLGGAGGASKGSAGPELPYLGPAAAQIQGPRGVSPHVLAHFIIIIEISFAFRNIQKALFIFKIYFFLLYLSHIKVFESCS